MPLIDIKPSECPCARVGSKDARVVIRSHPELDSCSWCDADVWVTAAGRESELPPVCTHCLGINAERTAWTQA